MIIPKTKEKKLLKIIVINPVFIVELIKLTENVMLEVV